MASPARKSPDTNRNWRCYGARKSVVARASRPLHRAIRTTQPRFTAPCTTHGSRRTSRAACSVLELDRLPIVLVLQTVRQELAIQRRRVDPENLRRALLLPARVVEHLHDVFLLQLVE